MQCTGGLWWLDKSHCLLLIMNEKLLLYTLCLSIFLECLLSSGYPNTCISNMTTPKPPEFCQGNRKKKLGGVGTISLYFMKLRVRNIQFDASGGLQEVNDKGWQSCFNAVVSKCHPSSLPENGQFLKPRLNQVCCVKRLSVSAASWHFDSCWSSHFSYCSGDSFSGQLWKDQCELFQSEKKNLMREMARFDVDLGRWSVWICRGRECSSCQPYER